LLFIARPAVLLPPRSLRDSLINEPEFRNFALWVVIFLLVLALVTLFQKSEPAGGAATSPTASS
jgi:hypothetical protein